MGGDPQSSLRVLNNAQGLHAGVPVLGFSPPLVWNSRGLSAARPCPRSRSNAPPVSMKMMTTGRTSLYSGICILASVLTNRLVFTPLDSIAMAQSRSDILGVITGATLLLYGVGKADIAARQKEAVQLRGVDVRKGFSNDENRSVGYEMEWAAEALLSAVPNIKSCAIFVNGTGWAFLGRFRDQDVTAELSPGGVLDLALKKGERAYLADMKTVPVKDVQFGFLPSNCQAVVVQPISESAAIILGADKPRPFTGADFGWLQAISDRLAVVLGANLKNHKAAQ